MSKFNKTISFDDFKEITKNTPEHKVNAFIETCKTAEKALKKVNIAKQELLQLFEQKADRFLFVYDNLKPYPDFTPSQLVQMMKNTNFWKITKIENENKIEIGFSYWTDSFSTFPIDTNDFINFLNSETYGR